MIITIVFSGLVLMHDVVYGNYRVRNATFHKHGPNVCAVEDLPFSNGASSYLDRKWPLDGHQHTCARKTLSYHPVDTNLRSVVFKYDCCEGFKSTYGRSGCTGVKSPKNVLETARELGANEFIRYVQQNGLYDLLTSGGPYTLFVPTDEAFAKMDDAFRLTLDSYESATETLKYHVVPRRIVTQNVTANEILSTLNDDRLQLRFNKYSTKIETINCVTIVRRNRVAQNGVVHLISAVLNPYSYSSRNLVQTINQNKELKIFSRMLEVSRMHQTLKETYQTLTVLAPTDNVLQLIPQNQLRRILNNETFSKAFVLKHILPTPVCLSAITDEHYIKSLANEHYVKFNCDKTNMVTAQGNCITNSLQLTSNGMIYKTNFALSTEEGKSVLHIMQNSGLSEFVQIVNIAGLAQTFENFNTLTIFAPTNKAIRCMNPTELYHIRSDPNAARAFVDFHVAKEIVTPENIYDGKIVECLGHGKKLRFQCVQNNFGIEGRQLYFQSPIGYNGAVHVVDKVLYPPTISVEDLIRKNDSFSLYAQAMDLLGASTWKSNKFCGDRNTYFIPTDYAFKKLGSVDLQRIFQSPTHLQNILDNHQTDRILPSTLIKDHLQYEVQTKNEIVRVEYKGNKLTVNNAEIIETDIMTTNGLVHIVDALILP